MQQVNQFGAFTGADGAIINQLLGSSIGATTGNVYYVDPVNGDDNSGTGLSPASAVQSLATGYALLSSGNNDVLVVIGNGLSGGSVRISSNFTWSKNAAHMIGMAAPSVYSLRARIAPPTAATAFANFFTISGSGCYFRNTAWFQGFGTGVAASICMTLTGTRCVFENCSLEGMGDTTSATSASSRTLLLNGGGEHTFRNCSMGLDTITRTGANSTIEWKADTVRNTWISCYFPAYVGAGGAPTFGYTGAAASLDREQVFTDCLFMNAIGSGATSMTAGFTLTAASGGLVVWNGTTGIVGATAICDSATKSQMYCCGPAASGAQGIGVTVT